MNQGRFQFEEEPAVKVKKEPNRLYEALVSGLKEGILQGVAAFGCLLFFSAIPLIIVFGVVDGCARIDMREDKCGQWCDSHTRDFKTQEEALSCYDGCPAWKVDK